MTERPLILCPACKWEGRIGCKTCHGVGKLTEGEFQDWVVHFLGGFFSDGAKVSDAAVFFNEIDNF